MVVMGRTDILAVYQEQAEAEKTRKGSWSVMPFIASGSRQPPTTTKNYFICEFAPFITSIISLVIAD